MAKIRKMHSIKINMSLNMTKSTMGILMPLITFPYISRTLGAENIGKISFVNSIISYFSLLAALGLRTYTTSVGAKYRDDPPKMKKFADSVFTINIIFTGIAYILLFALMVIIPKFHGYTSLFLILSLSIILTTIGMDWINFIYEDYLYITIRTIIFNLLQIVLLFIFVKTKSDVINYAIIFVISSSGANVLNYFYTRRYCRVGLTKNAGWSEHMKPILVLFATQAMVTIYVSSDTTILGFLCDERTVGIYNIAVKIYTVAKTVIASIIAVSIPRLSALFGQKNAIEFSKVAEDTYRTMLTVCIPAVIGLILLRNEIILLLSGNEYQEAVCSMVILSVAMFFCMGAYFWGQAILVPMGYENILLQITILSGIINIVLNFVLIPFWQENAAAFTTLIAEAITFFICRHYSLKKINFPSQMKTYFKIGIGCFGIIILNFFLRIMNLNQTLYVALLIMLAMAVYFIIEIVVKNESISSIAEKILLRFKRSY